MITTAEAPRSAAGISGAGGKCPTRIAEVNVSGTLAVHFAYAFNTSLPCASGYATKPYGIGSWTCSNDHSGAHAPKLRGSMPSSRLCPQIITRLKAAICGIGR